MSDPMTAAIAAERLHPRATSGILHWYARAGWTDGYHGYGCHRHTIKATDIEGREAYMDGYWSGQAYARGEVLGKQLLRYAITLSKAAGGVR